MLGDSVCDDHTPPVSSLLSEGTSMEGTLWVSLFNLPLCSRGDEEKEAQACVDPDLAGFFIWTSWGALFTLIGCGRYTHRDDFSALQQSQSNSQGSGRSQIMFSGQSPNFIHNNVDLTVISDFYAYFHLAQNQHRKCFE